MVGLIPRKLLPIKYVIDNLRRLKIRDTKDLAAYSQLCCVKAKFDSVVNQPRNGETWLPKVNIVYVSMENQENDIYMKEGKQRNFLLHQILVSLKWKMKLQPK